MRSTKVLHRTASKIINFSFLTGEIASGGDYISLC